MAEVTVLKHDFEKVVVNNVTPTLQAFTAYSPFKIAANGVFDMFGWNGTDYELMEAAIAVPKFCASAGRYALTAAGNRYITVTPSGVI